MNGLRIVAAAALVGISALAQPVRAADRLGHQGDEHGTARRRMSGRRLLCQEPPAPTGQFLVWFRDDADRWTAVGLMARSRTT